jgi:hypothetical protein
LQTAVSLWFWEFWGIYRTCHCYHFFPRIHFVKI